MGTLYIVVLGKIAFCYENVVYYSKGQGEAYILTYKTNVHSFVSKSKPRSGFVWWIVSLCHIMINNIFNESMSRNVQTKFNLVTTNENVSKSPRKHTILSIYR